MYENKNPELEKLFEEKGLGSEDIAGRVSFLVDILNIKQSGFGIMQKGEPQSFEVDLNNLSKTPKDILSAMYNDLCPMYAEKQASIVN